MVGGVATKKPRTSRQTKRHTTGPWPTSGQDQQTVFKDILIELEYLITQRHDSKINATVI